MNSANAFNSTVPNFRRPWTTAPALRSIVEHWVCSHKRMWWSRNYVIMPLPMAPKLAQFQANWNQGRAGVPSQMAPGFASLGPAGAKGRWLRHHQWLPDWPSFRSVRANRGPAHCHQWLLDWPNFGPVRPREGGSVHTKPAKWWVHSAVFAYPILGLDAHGPPPLPLLATGWEPLF